MTKPQIEMKSITTTKQVVTNDAINDGFNTGPSSPHADRVRIKQLEQRVKELQCELAIRTEPPFLIQPELKLTPGSRPAYGAGHDQAWRGKRHRNPYTAPHLIRCFQHGYEHGSRASLAAINALIRSTDAK